MSRVCEITGKKTMSGNNVSHAKNRTKRKFYVNLFKKRFFVPSAGEWITLKVSASAIREINRKGIEAVIKKSQSKVDINKS
jgi:large subunit ribosomal protein L28